ncbi:unnamed protein product [Brassica oleracea var. botrytis]
MTLSGEAAVSFIVAGLWLKLRTFPAKLRHVFVSHGWSFLLS